MSRPSARSRSGPGSPTPSPGFAARDPFDPRFRFRPPLGTLSARRLRAIAAFAMLLAAWLLPGGARAQSAEPGPTSGPAGNLEQTTLSPAPLDPKARLLAGDSASEYWTLYVELDSGHRIAQRFLITNAGPGDHSAVAVGHLMESGRPPYRYVNGRQRHAWTLSPDRLFLDIAASHLDLHRPRGALKITKDDIEIRLDFDLSDTAISGKVPAAQLPRRYEVEVLAVASVTQGTIKAPWMAAPLAVKGHTWLIHSWTPDDEADLLDRRVDVFGRAGETAFYALAVQRAGGFAGAWQVLSQPAAAAGPEARGAAVVFPARWQDGTTLLAGNAAPGYPVPNRFLLAGRLESGEIRLSNEWLRFDPLEVIPQPFRWFIRRSTQPQEVWADSRIAVSIRRALEDPSLPPTGDALRVSNSQREIEDETTDSNVKGVASITFMNPIDRR